MVLTAGRRRERRSYPLTAPRSTQQIQFVYYWSAQRRQEDSDQVSLPAKSELACEMFGLSAQGRAECEINLTPLPPSEQERLIWKHAAVGDLSFSSRLGHDRHPDEPFLDVILYCLSEQTVSDIMICWLSSMQQKKIPLLRLFMKEKIDFLSDQFRKEDFWERRFYVEKFITWFEAKFA